MFNGCIWVPMTRRSMPSDWAPNGLWYPETPVRIDFTRCRTHKRCEKCTCYAPCKNENMIEVSERVTIPVPADEVWKLLANPELIIGCVPGASLDEVGPNGLYKATISVAFGPTVATFKGEAQVKYDEIARTCAVEGRGIDGRGASSALASGTVTVSGTDTTQLLVEGEFSIAGPLETFAEAGGVHVARALLREFADNLTKFVQQRGGAANSTTESGAPVAPPKAASISATALLLEIFPVTGWKVSSRKS